MKRFAMVFALVLATLHFITPKPVFACTPTPTGYPPYTLEDQVNATPIILEGTVMSVSGETYDQVATVQVQQYLKGTGATEVTINHFGSSSMCLTTVAIGDHLIFFVYDNPEGFRAAYMSAGAAVKAANPENIAAIRAIVEPSITATPPAEISSQPSSASPFARTLWGVVVSLLVLVSR